MQNKTIENEALESNSDNGFLTKEEAFLYAKKRKESWGSNLVTWIEEHNGRFFVCLNFFD